MKIGRFVRFDAHQLEHLVDDHWVQAVDRTFVLRTARRRRTATMSAQRGVDRRSCRRSVSDATMRWFGSVRQRGRLYEASYWDNGRRHVAPTTFSTKSDARALLATVETDIRGGGRLDRS